MLKYGIVTGNPGVTARDPYPYPTKPVPLGYGFLAGEVKGFHEFLLTGWLLADGQFQP